MSSRYDANNSEGTFEPGSNDEVLANKLGITDPEEMVEAELFLLRKLYESVLVADLPDRALTMADIRTWHHRWLGNIYAWAGEDRTVNMSKGEFMFAAAAQVPRLLATFESDCLAQLTPCRDLDTPRLIQAIARTHVEFILIHPFREGNGRLSRLLADVMALQGGRDPLDYSAWDANKETYFGAIRRGLMGDYLPMERLVAQALVQEKDGT